MTKVLLAGFGAANQSVAKSLRRNESTAEVVVFDDNPMAAQQELCDELDMEFVGSPDESKLRVLVSSSDYVVPTPSMADSHLMFELLGNGGARTLSEYDIFAASDKRPVLAVTGTNGKTTVTELVAQMLNRSGIVSVACGNADVALTEASADKSIEMFVVEASSFQLRFTKCFAPVAGAWLNFAPDHLDVHSSMEDYEKSKRKVWGAGTLPVCNLDDSAVMRNVCDICARERKTFSVSSQADYMVSQGRLWAEGNAFCEIVDLPRGRPHDISNALAATAVAVAGGGSLQAAADVLGEFKGLEHRLEFVAESGRVRWFNDSKATTPHAVNAAVSGFQKVVLIAGGRNKGLDLAELQQSADRLSSVVALGEAAQEIEQVFGNKTVIAESMVEAVEKAGSLAKEGDAVLLSPGCASYDWYGSYRERGADFKQKVFEFLAMTEETRKELS